MRSVLLVRVVRLAVVPTILAAAWLGPPAVASSEAAGLEDTSLVLPPADAAFYSAGLRNREQIEAVINSRAWAKIMAMPVVQMGLDALKAEASDPRSVPGQVLAAVQDPAGRPVVDTVLDMLSQEVFVYGDASCVDALELFQGLLGSAQYGPAMMQLGNAAEGMPIGDQQAMLLFTTLADNLDRLKVPGVTVGFKLTDKRRAADLLDQLYEIASAALEEEPKLSGRLKRQTVDGHEYLTFTLNGRMIPWRQTDIFRLADRPWNEGQVEKVVAHIRNMKLVVALGIREDYLLLSIGPSTKSLARLGKGRLLVDRPELAPLKPFAQQRLTSINYVSEALMAQLSYAPEDIDSICGYVDMLLPATGLPEAEMDRIRGDAAALADDIKTLLSEPGAITSFGFLTDRGLEGYTYDWREHASLDGSKPLDVLNHVGGDPLLVFASRSKPQPQRYEMLVKWLKVGYGYFERYGLPNTPPPQREEFDRGVELFLPLLARLDKATREMLLPSLEDGQAALVIDAKLTSRQFLQALPPTPEPMPMLEPAAVVGVSDADLLRRAFGEYRDVLDAALDAVRQLAPGEIPESFRFYDPEMTEDESGTIWGWALPEAAGVDPRIVPNIGLSDSMGVASASREHTRRLLKPTPLAAKGVLQDLARPRTSATLFDWAGLVDAATPWARFAAWQIMADSPGASGDADDPAEVAGILDQVDTVLEVLKVVRSYTSESYFDDENAAGGLKRPALVTHRMWEFQDLPE